MYDYKVADDLFLIKDKESDEFGHIYFCGDSFYGYYTVQEFADLLSQILKQYRVIVEEITNGKNH